MFARTRKESKANKKQRDKRRKLLKINSHNEIYFLFSYFIFRQINLLNMHKNVFGLFSSYNFRLVCLLQ